MPLANSRFLVAPAVSKIEDITLAVDGPEIDLDNIPQTFAHLHLVCFLRSSAAGHDLVGLQLNGDAGANYGGLYVQSIGGAPAGTIETGLTRAIAGHAPVTGAGTGERGAAIELWIPFYRSARRKVIAVKSGRKDQSTATHATMDGIYETTAVAAIDRIRLFPITGPNFLADSRATLYGLT